MSRSATVPSARFQPWRRGSCAFVLAPLALTFASAVAHAQADINPPLPNVMLLVDTSGSMEYKLGAGSFPTCNPTGGVSEKSRWIDLVEVLTGSINDYRCQAVSRTAVGFLTGEYGQGGPTGTRPYDYLYENPYHRPMSTTCVAAPGALSAVNAYAFPEDDPGTAATYEGAIRYHSYSNLNTPCTFNQSSDGIMDAFERAIRFGLMTFDPLSDPSTGVSGTPPSAPPNYAQGMRGTWSYVWGSSRMANPAGCLEAPTAMEVGARNAAAPPWEGRMVAFGNPDTASLDYLSKKSQIERVILATRPYGATPIAGMLHDSRDFFRNDTTQDPFSTTRALGPRSDPYVTDTSSNGEGCRKQYQILLTDGQPNMDLRPFCEGGGVCPFDKPEDIAHDLATGQYPVQTFVVGFALPTFTVNGSPVTCNDLVPEDFDETDPTRPCGNPTSTYRDNAALQACCVLNRIAVNGGLGTNPRAFFADDRQELASALSRILTEATPVTSRTQPVVAGAAGTSKGFRFYSSVRPVSFQPWVGVLERQRYRCDAQTQQPVLIPLNREEGDDFAANLNAQPDRRVFASVRAGNGSEPIRSRRSVRPYYTPAGTPDGAGVYSGARAMSRQSELASDVSAEAMELTSTSCSGGLTANQCRDRYLKWLVGLNNGTSYTRCVTPNTDRCYLLGDILHSTPRVVGPPSAVLLDETYDAFTLAKRLRPVVLYTSSNDGFLHAFKVAATDPTDTDRVLGPGRTNNELWAFLPPAVLPDLPSQYPFTHQLLLDGVPIVEDVVAVRPSADVDDIRFQRSAANARVGATGIGNINTWRSVLLQSFGPARGGYFAVDVTDPVPDANNLDNESFGPRFLWQLTTDTSGNALFGIGGATPAITTLFFDPAGSSSQASALEIPVAILPGGRSAPGSPDPEPDAGRSFGASSRYDGFAPRTQVPRYATGLGGRSLSIVRLDTGEVIRTFRQSADEISDANLKLRVIATNIDSPITGQPSAFPAGTGAVADRVYVGDQDGRLWRVNLASTDPDNWTMELFFDAFPASWPGDSTFTHDYDDGQPILLPPVVSVDERGDVTINVATGDQDTLGGSASMKNYVWSLTERTTSDRSVVTTKVNWFKPFVNGERVVGPMELFNSQLFFATYTPAAVGSAACSNGSSRVWGMDYLRANGSSASATPPLNDGGEPRLPDPDNATAFRQYLSAAQVTGSANAIIFGVSVAQQPTCSVSNVETTSDYLGYGEHHQLTNVNPGNFELVMHTGGTDDADPTDQMSSNVETIPLRPPPSAARVDSWAALVE